MHASPFFPMETETDPRNRLPGFAGLAAEHREADDDPPERLLQCVWFDPALRPAHLRTHDGERVTVEHPGRWNLEAGPDFLGACVRVGQGRRRIAGDVEVHIHPMDWIRHGHNAHSHYARVRVHLTYHAGLLPPGTLPPGAIQIALAGTLLADPSFSFDMIDAGAYPHAARTSPSPCSRVLSAWPAETAVACLHAAGEARLHRKARRLRRAIRDRGADQALYEELLTALGYSHNKRPCRRLAARLPYVRLRELADGSAGRAYALLAGMAGLLPDPAAHPVWDDETRTQVRAWWDAWWKCRAALEDEPLRPDEWRVAGLRPLNHPLRRLMAAAVWFSRAEPPAALLRRLIEADPAALPGRLAEELGAPPEEGYWSRRPALGANARAARPIAFAGADRLRAILTNVVAPYAATLDLPPDRLGALWRHLPPAGGNGRLRHAARAVLGPDPPPSWYRSGLGQQGLLLFFNDYCLMDRTGCTHCALPRRLHSWVDEARAPDSCPDARSHPSP